MVFLHHVELPGLFPLTKGLDRGVIVFFVLSGYLLYGQFLRAAQRGTRFEPTTYAIRRAARILPAYLFAAFVVAWARYPWMLNDPVGLALTTDSSIAVVWTLQIEILFYATLPIGAAVLMRFREEVRLRLIVLASALSLLGTIVLMAVELMTAGVVFASDVSSYASFLWAFGAGMFVAELDAKGALSRPAGARWAAVGVLFIAFGTLAQIPRFLDVISGIGAAALIAWVVSRPAKSRGFRQLAIAGGALSYSVYLWHHAVIEAVNRPDPSWGGAVLAAVITVSIAVVAYVLVERPGIAVGRWVSGKLRELRVDRDAVGMPVVYEPMAIEAAGAPQSPHG